MPTNEYKIIFSFLASDGYRQQDIDVIKATTPQQAANWLRKQFEGYYHLHIEHIFSFEQNRWSACTAWN